MKKIAIAAGGAREGLIAINGWPSMAEDNELREAFVNWAMKWTPPKGSAAPSREAEETKWDNDFARKRDGKGSGWRQLKVLAAEYCNVPSEYMRDLAYEEAAHAFQGHTEDLKLEPGETPQQALDRLHPTSIGLMVRNFNEKHCVVGDAGKVMVWEEKHDPFLKRDYYVRYDFKAFLNLHLKTTVEVQNKKTGQAEREAAAPIWLSHPDGRIYQGGAMFDPSGKDHGKDVLHLWKGYGVQARPGSWSKLNRHIVDIICWGNETNACYLLDWIANMIQNPASFSEVAVVAHGPEGCGKGILAQIIIRILGQHGTAISDAEQVVGKFNYHLRDLIFLFADEAFFAGNSQHANKLKFLTGSPTFPIEGKGANIVNAPNFLHIFMASNNEWVVPAALGSRRFFVLEVSGAKVGDKKYFDDIMAEMEVSGYEAFLHAMQTRDLSKFNPRRAPVTDALIRQRLQSMDTTNSWWFDVLYKGYIFESKLGLESYFTQWHGMVSRGLLFASYLAYAKSRNERHPLSREGLGNFIAPFISGIDQKGNRPARSVIGEHLTNEHDVPQEPPEPNADGKTAADTRYLGANRSIPDLVYKDREWCYRLGSLAEARNKFTEVTQLKLEWPEDGTD